MHEYFLYRARTIIDQFEIEYKKDQIEAIKILKQRLGDERDKIRHIAMDILEYKYPEVKI